MHRYNYANEAWANSVTGSGTGSGTESGTGNDLPLVFSPKRERNMVKLRGPGASLSMSSSILGSGSRPKITPCRGW